MGYQTVPNQSRMVKTSPYGLLLIIIVLFTILCLLAVPVGAASTSVEESHFDNQITPNKRVDSMNTTTHTEWSMFQVDPSNTGYIGNLAVPESKPHKKWQFNTSGYVFSSPAVGNGKIYFGTNSFRVESDDNALYSVDADTGEMLWKFDTGGRINSGPAVVNGTVFVGSGDGKLYAIDADTGEEIWNHTTGGGIASSPAVSKNTVVFGSRDNHVYAIDTNTGKKVWKFKTDGWVIPSTAIKNNTVYAASFDSNLYALNLENGEKKWSYELDDNIKSDPAVGNDYVFVGGNGKKRLYAFDRVTGELVWSSNTTGFVWGSPAITSDLVITSTLNSQNNIIAFDKQTGELKWRNWLNTSDGGGSISSSPTITESSVVIGAPTGGLHALDRDTGKEKWLIESGSKIGSTVAVTNSGIIFGNKDGLHKLVANQPDPVISDFRVTSPDSGVLRVGFNSTKELSEIGVGLKNETDDEFLPPFRTANFSRDGNTYTAQRRVSEPATYRAALIRAMTDGGTDYGNHEQFNDTATVEADIILDDFEDDFSGWNVLLGDRSDLSITEDSVRGTGALRFKDVGHKVRIRETLPDGAQPTNFSLWFKYDSSNDNNFNIVLYGPNGEILTHIHEFLGTVHVKRNHGSLSERFVDVADVQTNIWYKIELYDFNYEQESLDARVRDRSGSVVGKREDISFMPNAPDSWKYLNITDALGNNNVADPFWIDHIQYTTKSSSGHGSGGGGGATPTATPGAETPTPTQTPEPDTPTPAGPKPVVTGCSDIGVRINRFSFPSNSRLQTELLVTRMNSSKRYKFALDAVTGSSTGTHTFVFDGANGGTFNEQYRESDFGVDFSDLTKLRFHPVQCSQKSSTRDISNPPSNGTPTPTPTPTPEPDTPIPDPTVEVEVDSSNPREGESVRLSVRATAPAGRVTDYNWHFGDGTSGDGKNVYHTYDSPGSYDVSMSITDSEGQVATDTTEIEVQNSPEPTIESITPEVEGSALEGVEFRNEYTVDIESEESIEEVRFELDGETYVDKNGGDGWSQEIDMSVLDGDSQLTVTAVDASGDTDRETAHISMTGIPTWLEDLKESGEVEVEDDTIIISKQVPNPPVDAEMNIPRSVPKIGGTQEFEMRSEFKVRYDMPEEDARVIGEGELEIDILGYAGQGSVDANGRLDPNDEWDLQRGEITVRAQITTISQSWEVTPSTGNNAIDKHIPIVDATLETSPRARVRAEIDDRNSQLQVTRGTLAPGVDTSGSLEQTFGDLEIVLEARGEVTGALDVPEPYDTRATAEIHATGSASYWIFESSYTVGPFREEINGGARKTVHSIPQETVEFSNWTIDDDRAESAPLATTQQSSLTRLSSRSSPVHPGQLERVTADTIVDRSPALQRTPEGYMVVWERRDPAANLTSGNDIYWSTRTAEGWSEPAPMTNNTKLEGSPSIAGTPDSESYLAAWTVINQTVSEADVDGPDDLLRETEIAFATSDGQEWSDPVPITNNANPDSEVSVARGENGWLVVWLHDPSPDNTSTKQEVRYARIGSDRDITETGQIGTGYAPAVAADATGEYRVAYLAPDTPMGRNGSVVTGTYNQGFDETDRYGTTRFRDLDLSGQSLTWTDGPSNDPTIWYLAESTPQRVGVDRNLTSTDEIGVFAKRDSTVLTYRGGLRGQEGKRIFYQIQHDGTWRSARSIAGGERPEITFWQNAVATDESGFLSVFMGRNLDKSQENDLFAVRHTYLPEFDVSATTTANSTTHSVGDSFTIEYTVENAGDQPANTDFDVVVRADGAELTRRSHDSIGIGGRATGTVTATVGDARNYTVEVVPEKNIDQLTGGEAMTTIRTFDPAVRVKSATATRDGELVNYEATVENTGLAPVQDVDYAYENDNERLDTGTLDSIAAGGQQNVSGRVPVTAITSTQASRIVLDPDEQTNITVEAGRSRSVRPLAPDLSVSGSAVTYYDAGSDAVAEVIVSNTGDGATSGTLRVLQEGETVGSREFDIEAAPGTGNTTFVTVNITVSDAEQGDQLTFVAESDIQDRNPLQNAGQGEITAFSGTVDPGAVTTAIEAIAGQSQPADEVTFTDVLGAIEAFNQGTTIAGEEIGFQAVLDAIKAFNEGGTF